MKLSVLEWMVAFRGSTPERAAKFWFTATPEVRAECLVEAQEFKRQTELALFRLTPPSDEEITALRRYDLSVETPKQTQLLARRGWVHKPEGCKMFILTDEGRTATRTWVKEAP